MKDVEQVLEALGIEITARSGDELTALCPAHEHRTGKPDHNPSWQINSQTGLSRCWSCRWFANLDMLVAEVYDMRDGDRYDVDRAQGWLAGHLEINVGRLRERAGEALARLDRQDIPALLPITESRLALYVQPPDEVLHDRLISRAAARAYGILWEPHTSRWITPVRDPEGKLIGWQEKGHTDRWFRNQPHRMKKSLFVYGYAGDEPSTVVESPLDCARIYTTTGRWGVSTMGAQTSLRQHLILGGISDLVAAYDNDREGRAATRALLTAGIDYGFSFKAFNYLRANPSCKDPGDMIAREISRGHATATHSVRGWSAIAPTMP